MNRLYSTAVSAAALLCTACSMRHPAQTMPTGSKENHSPTVASAVVAEFSAAGDAGAATPAVQGGTIRFRVVDAASGRELPARVFVRGADGTPDPMLGPNYEAGGAGFAVVAASGSGQVRVPAGRYTLTFTHGPEWTIARLSAEVDESAGADLVARLEHAVPMSDWTACDLHVHARPSGDSQVSIEDRVASLVAVGVEFATPTEHNTVGSYAAGVAALPRAAQRGAHGGGLGWVPAVEVTTDAEGDSRGHFNVYPYEPDPNEPDGAPPPFRESPRQIFRAVRASHRDAIIQVNHPRMAPNIGYFTQTQLDPRTNTARSPDYDPGYDAIEVFNGFYLGTPVEVETVLHDWFALLGSGARYIGTASSDSHAIAYDQAGYPRTYVYTPGAGDAAPDGTEVVRSLRAGHAFGTSGPLLFAQVGDALPGDTVRTRRPEVSLQVRVMAAPWVDVDQVEVYRNGELLETLPVPPSNEPLRLERTVPLPVTAHPGFVVVVARGDHPMDAVLPNQNARPFAFTNPIWIERAR